MKTTYLSALVLLASASAVSLESMAAGNATAGKAKAATCMGCHGIPSYNNAYPSYHVPRLGGQHAQYLVSALHAYKAGKRSHKTMQAQASTLSDQDMDDIAAFFAASGK